MERRSTTIEGTTHLAVVGKEGAVSFYYFEHPLRPDRSNLMAGDVVTHQPMTSSNGFDECDYVPGGCDTSYWSGTNVLDMLVDDGVDAVFDKLTDVYERTFLGK